MKLLAQAATAILALLLLVVTAKYAHYTYQIWCEMQRQVRLSRYQLRPWLNLADVALGTRENAGKNQPMFKPNGGDLFDKSPEPFRVLIGVKNRGASPAADVHLQVHWCLKETAPQTIEECKQLESGITPDANLFLEERKHGFLTPGEELFTEREFSLSDLERIRHSFEIREQLYAIGAATYKYAECRYRTRFCLRYFPHGLHNESFLIGCDMGEVPEKSCGDQNGWETDEGPSVPPK